MKNFPLPIAMAFLIGYSCSKLGPAENHVFEKLPPDRTGIRFANHIKSTDDFNVFKYRNFYNGGGVGIADVNNDGLADVYLIGNQIPNKLYLNKGNFQFEDITETAGVSGNKGWSTGISFVDLNNDGLLDLYVSNAGYLDGDNHENELYINQGDLTFVERAKAYGLNDPGYTTHAAFFDYDKDGDLDAYILNNSFIPVNSLNYSNRRDLYAEEWPVKDFVKGGGDKLLRNDNGLYVDVSRESGIYGSLIGFGLGITLGDVNGDNYIDIYVSNDFYERDYLYINRGDGTFSEEITQWTGHISLSSMGADMADINNDGLQEIFVTEMLPESDERIKRISSFEQYNTYLLKRQKGFYHQFMHNTLQYNNGNNTFSEISWFSGVSASDWSWGALIFDADNDGHKDLFVSNGVHRDVTNQDFIDFFANDILQEMAITGKKEEVQKVIDLMPSEPQSNKLFLNNGDLTFADRSEAFGISDPSFSNGAAYADLDNDGDLDLVVNNVNQEAFVYRNSSEKNGKHFIAVRLLGDSANRFAIGSTIGAYCNGHNHNLVLIPTRGFQSSVGYKAVIGLGDNRRLDSLVVRWPDDKLTTLRDVPVDTLLTIPYEWAVDRPSVVAKRGGNRYFSEVGNSMEAFEEDYFVDFFQEGLIIKMLSREGPKADAGDVNGDGKEDVFIGAPANQEGALYLQTEEGFVRKRPGVFGRDAAYEDTFVKFFDVDGDGDLDLFVGSGGNNTGRGERLMSDRIYVNDGKGGYALLEAALPYNAFNTSLAIPVDFDHDGDLDLFVGSRSFPGVYGISAQSFLYRNDGSGHFDDLTARFLPELRRAGLITDATISNINANDKPDLILVGEWMAPVAYEFDGWKLRPLDIGLSKYKGWWYALETADLDNDGDQDLIIGNRGENFYFTASDEAPARLWIKDFDGNGTVEKIATRFIGGKDKPIALKRELTEQLPLLKKQNLKHSEYAKNGIRDLFTEQQLEDAKVKEATWFKSVVAINDGSGKFTVAQLPAQVQFSCVCDIYCTDINGDNYMDLVMGGNDSGFRPQFSKLDATFGHVLLNDRQGSFDWMPNQESGFFVTGDVKQILELQYHGSPHILVTRNEAAPKLFKINK